MSRFVLWETPCARLQAAAPLYAELAAVQMLRMAGRQQVIDGHSQSDWGVAPSLPQAILGVGGVAPFGDDPKDQGWIKQGFRYYDAYNARRAR